MAARRPLVLVDGQIRQMTVDEFNDLRWQMIPIGAEFPIDSTTAGVDIPPTDNPNYRYIKLTASDSYNDGVLTSESVSGSAPLVQATAVINDAASPMDGETVRLINTERRFLRPGSSGEVEADAMQNITGTVGQFYGGGNGSPAGAFGGSSYVANPFGGATYGGVKTLAFDASLIVRTASENRVKSLGRDYYKRIR